MNQPIKFTLKEGIKYAFCTCELSNKKPFCDGNHRGTSFKPLKFVAKESKEVLLCTCEQSKNPPYCDGTHKKI
jgi:CDGSH-type Zn-finger protein